MGKAKKTRKASVKRMIKKNDDRLYVRLFIFTMNLFCFSGYLLTELFRKKVKEVPKPKDSELVKDV